MLNDICRELNNWFETSKYFDKFTIKNGEIDLSDLVVDGSLQNNQYFRIVGSVFNDGVYQYPASDLTDEVFEGAVWPMAIPKEILDLSSEIPNWISQNEEALNSPFQSESFGGYSYSKASGNTSGNGDGSITWQSHFASKLNKWRKMRCRY